MKPSKAAMELAKVVLATQMGGWIDGVYQEQQEAIASLIDNHPAVKGLLGQANSDHHSNGSHPGICSGCTVLANWQPKQEEKEDAQG